MTMTRFNVTLSNNDNAVEIEEYDNTRLIDCLVTRVDGLRYFDLCRQHYLQTNLIDDIQLTIIFIYWMHIEIIIRVRNVM